MKTYFKFRSLIGIGCGLMLAGAASVAQAGITITRASDNAICTEGTLLTDQANNITTVSNLAGCTVPGNFSMTVSPTGTGAGTVSGMDFNCTTGSTVGCSKSYAPNTALNVTLTAAPKTGSTFAGWSSTGVTPACSGTSTCVINQSITANLTVTAQFTANTPPPGECGPLPPNVTVVEAGSLDTSFPQKTYAPRPETITAFKVVVPEGFIKKNDFTATKTSAAVRSKLVVVSACPGVLQTPPDNDTDTSKDNNKTACSFYALEASKVKMTAGTQAYYCQLQAGKTYYINAISKTKLSDTSYSCSDPSTNCTFYGSRSSPY